MQVYPAASLVAYARSEASIYYIDPAPHISYELRTLSSLKVIEKPATVGVPALVHELLAK